MASFEDIVGGLEAEWDRAEADELAAEVADRTRGEFARTTLVQRLRPVVGHALAVATVGGFTARGQLRGTGPDWLLLREDPANVARETVVPLAAVLWVEGLSRQAAIVDDEGAVAARTTFGLVLRRLVRDRAEVAVVLVDGTTLTGVLDRVGVDHAELALVPVGEARRRGAVLAVRAIPLRAISAVRRG